MQGRLAQPHDLEAVLELWQGFVRDEQAIIEEEEPESVDPWKARLAVQIDEEKILVLESEGKLVGFAGFVEHENSPWVPPNVAYFVDLYLQPEVRGRGGLQVLFDAIETHLTGRYQAVWTNTHQDNLRVQHILRKNGFVSLEAFQLKHVQQQVYFQRKL